MAELSIEEVLKRYHAGGSGDQSDSPTSYEPAPPLPEPLERDRGFWGVLYDSVPAASESIAAFVREAWYDDSPENEAYLNRMAGIASRAAADRMASYSPEVRRKLQATFFEDSDNPGNTFWDDPTAIAYQAAQSAGGSALSILGFVFGGWAGGAVGAGMEGAISYGEFMNEGRNKVFNSSQEEISQLPLYRKLRGEGHSDKQARELIFDRYQTAGPVMFAAVAGTSLVGGRVGGGAVKEMTKQQYKRTLKQSVAEGAKRVGTGMLSEGAEESVQSSSEYLAGQYAVDEPATVGGLSEAALRGGTVGGFMGGAITGVTAPAQVYRENKGAIDADQQTSLQNPDIDSLRMNETAVDAPPVPGGATSEAEANEDRIVPPAEAEAAEQALQEARMQQAAEAEAAAAAPADWGQAQAYDSQTAAAPETAPETAPAPAPETAPAPAPAPDVEIVSSVQDIAQSAPEAVQEAVHDPDAEPAATPEVQALADRTFTVFNEINRNRAEQFAAKETKEKPKHRKNADDLVNVIYDWVKSLDSADQLGDGLDQLVDIYKDYFIFPESAIGPALSFPTFLETVYPEAFSSTSSSAPTGVSFDLPIDSPEPTSGMDEEGFSDPEYAPLDPETELQTIDDLLRRELVGRPEFEDAEITQVERPAPQSGPYKEPAPKRQSAHAIREQLRQAEKKLSTLEASDTSKAVAIFNKRIKNLEAKKAKTATKKGQDVTEAQIAKLKKHRDEVAKKEQEHEAARAEKKKETQSHIERLQSQLKESEAAERTDRKAQSLEKLNKKRKKKAPVKKVATREERKASIRRALRKTTRSQRAESQETLDAIHERLKREINELVELSTEVRPATSDMTHASSVDPSIVGTVASLDPDGVEGVLAKLANLYENRFTTIPFSEMADMFTTLNDAIEAISPFRTQALTDLFAEDYGKYTAKLATISEFFDKRRLIPDESVLDQIDDMYARDARAEFLKLYNEYYRQIGPRVSKKHRKKLAEWGLRPEVTDWIATILDTNRRQVQRDTRSAMEARAKSGLPPTFAQMFLPFDLKNSNAPTGYDWARLYRIWRWVDIRDAYWISLAGSAAEKTIVDKRKMFLNARMKFMQTLEASGPRAAFMYLNKSNLLSNIVDSELAGLGDMILVNADGPVPFSSVSTDHHFDFISDDTFDHFYADDYDTRSEVHSDYGDTDIANIDPFAAPTRTQEFIKTYGGDLAATAVRDAKTRAPDPVKDLTERRGLMTYGHLQHNLDQSIKATESLGLKELRDELKAAKGLLVKEHQTNERALIRTLGSANAQTILKDKNHILHVIYLALSKVTDRVLGHVSFLKRSFTGPPSISDEALYRVLNPLWDQEGNVLSAKKLMAHLIDNNAIDPQLRRAAYELYNVADSTLPVISGQLPTGTAGQFMLDPNGAGTITIDSMQMATTGGAGLTHTLLHEMAHASTLKGVATNAGLRATLEILRKNAYLKATPEQQKHRGFHDVYEFVAEAFANADFQNILRNISMPTAGTVQGQRTMWRKFVDFVRRRILRMKPSYSIMDEIMSQELIDPESHAMMMQDYKKGLKNDALVWDENLKQSYALTLNPAQLIDPDKYAATYTARKVTDRLTDAVFLNSRTEQHVSSMFDPLWFKYGKKRFIAALTRAKERRSGYIDKLTKPYDKFVSWATQTFNRTDPMAVSKYKLLFVDGTSQSINFMEDWKHADNAHLHHGSPKDVQKRKNIWKRLNTEWSDLVKAFPQLRRVGERHVRIYRDTHKNVVNAMMLNFAKSIISAKHQGLMDEAQLQKEAQQILDDFADPAKHDDLKKRIDKDNFATLEEFSDYTKLRGLYVSMRRTGKIVVRTRKSGTAKMSLEDIEYYKGKYRTLRVRGFDKNANPKDKQDVEYTFRAVDSFDTMWQGKKFRDGMIGIELGFGTLNAEDIKNPVPFTSEPVSDVVKHAPAFMDKYRENLENTTFDRDDKELDGELRAKAIGAAEMASINLLPDYSLLQAFRKRKGIDVLGEFDHIKAAAQYGVVQGRYIGKLTYRTEVVGALADIKRVAMDAEDVNHDEHLRMMRVWEHLVRRELFEDNALVGSTAMDFAHFANNTAFVYMMSSLSTMVVNMTQVPIMSFKYLAARHGGMRAILALGRAYAVFGKMALIHTAKNALSTDRTRFDTDMALREALIEEYKTKDVQEYMDLVQYLRDHKALAATMTMEAHMLAKGETGFFHKLVEMVAFPNHMVEIANRSVTALAAYELMKADKRTKYTDMSRKQKFRATLEAVNETQFHYDTEMRPNWMKTWYGMIIGQFRIYQFGMVANQVDTLRRAVGRGVIEADDAKIAQKEIAYMIMAMVPMGGVAGLMFQPFLLGAAAMWYILGNAINDEEDEPLDEYISRHLNYVLGEDNANVLKYGLPYALGIDLHGRIGLHNILMLDRYRGEGVNGWKAFVAEQGIGPFGNRLLEVGSALYEAKDPTKVVKLLLPKFASDAFKASHYAMYGVDDARNRVLYEPTTMEILYQLAGFTPSGVSNMYNKRQTLMSVRDRWADQKQGHLDKLYALESRAERMDYFRKHITPWNKNKPKGAKITWQNAVLGVRGRVEYQQNWDAGRYGFPRKEFEELSSFTGIN